MKIVDELKLNEKINSSYKVRITTFVRGTCKEKFFNDCMIKGVCEAELARDIIEHYYQQKNPVYETELQKQLKEKFRL